MLCMNRLLAAATVVVCSAGACSSSVGREQNSDLDADVLDPVRLPPFPEETVLCRIVYNETGPDEVARVLGEPTHSEDPGSGSGSVSYDYDGGASLYIGFLHGVFCDAMVANAPYPSCWTAQERALTAGLQGLAMPMSNGAGGAK
jgi:hypothetical protein